jgi:hypothetical protein
VRTFGGTGVGGGACTVFSFHGVEVPLVLRWTHELVYYQSMGVATTLYTFGNTSAHTTTIRNVNTTHVKITTCCKMKVLLKTFDFIMSVPDRLAGHVHPNNIHRYSITPTTNQLSCAYTATPRFN